MEEYFTLKRAPNRLIKTILKGHTLYKSANPNPLFSFGRWKKDKAGDFNEEKLLKRKCLLTF